MIYFDELQFSEIIAVVNKISNINEGRNIKVGFLRNITIDNYLPLIKYLLYKAKFNVEIKLGGYNIVLQEVLGIDSPMSKYAPDIIGIFLNIEVLSPNLYHRYTELNEKEINDEKEYLLDYIKKLFETIEKNVHSKVIFHLFELPSNPSYDISEAQTQQGQRNLIDQINKSILELSKDLNDIYFVDLNIIRERLGSNKYFDKRYWYIGKAPFTLEALKEIAIENLKIINSLYGKTKKCLVLDCDNTLWGGIVGEAGFENIKIGNTYPGNMYLDFQRQILNLYNKGVILAINSKNNEADVLEVLEKHPDMLLRKKHFACIYANWNNKVENLKYIAQDLNIGLDSLVFVDDSVYECNLIKEKLKEVDVIDLPKEVYKYADTISSCGLFDKLQYTIEDRKRGELYKVEVDRKKHLSLFTDLTSYYKSLEMVIKIEPVNQFSISRVSQLTQRTNQFNLTTKRYSEDDIRRFFNSEDFEVLVLSLSDKFGEMGIVGVQILDYSDKKKAKIDSFMMSCRIIGRGVENVFLRAGIEKCLDKKYNRVIALYCATKKNNLAADFYSANGFNEIPSDGKCKIFQINNLDQLTPFENNFKQIIIE